MSAAVPVGARWTLLITFVPVPEQGWEEQNEGEDFAGRVITEIKRFLEYDDEISNDYRGEGFDENVLWLLSEDRTRLWVFGNVLEQLESAINAVIAWTIPLTMVLVRDEAWPDDGVVTVMVESP
jgi:hypothetical protein